MQIEYTVLVVGAFEGACQDAPPTSTDDGCGQQRRRLWRWSSTRCGGMGQGLSVIRAGRGTLVSNGQPDGDLGRMYRFPVLPWPTSAVLDETVWPPQQKKPVSDPSSPRMGFLPLGPRMNASVDCLHGVKASDRQRMP